jgi:hypothetical protein
VRLAQHLAGKAIIIFCDAVLIVIVLPITACSTTKLVNPGLI